MYIYIYIYIYRVKFMNSCAPTRSVSERTNSSKSSVTPTKSNAPHLEPKKGDSNVSTRLSTGELAFTCLCADPGSGPSERGEHRPFE